MKFNLKGIAQKERYYPKKKKSSKKTIGPEKIIEREIMRYFKAHGFLVVKHTSSVTMSEYTGSRLRSYFIANIKASAGLSDLFIAKGGICAFLEVKTKTGRQTDSQKKFQVLCEECGINYSVVRNLEDAKQVWDEFVKQHIKNFHTYFSNN